jgi:outer membrane protein, heavy metal efflux system
MKIKTIQLILFSILLLLNSFSFAQSKEELMQIENRFSKELSLPDLLEYAYESNPSITVSKESWRMFIENYRIEKSYPDPQVMVTYFPSPIETRLGPQDWNLNLSQPIPIPGKLAQKGKVFEADVKISKLKVDKTIKDIVTSISSSYYELIYIQTAIEVAKANFNLNQELVKISENAYSQNKALFYDVSKAQAQTAQIQYDILLLKELEHVEKARLNTILNRAPYTPLGRAQNLLFRDVVYTLNEIYDLSKENQEDILIANEKIQKSEESIKLSKYDSLPSFKLGLFYAGIGYPEVPSPPKDAGDDAVGIQFGLNIPLWFGKNKSKVSKAIAGKRKAKAEKFQIENQIKEKISRIWFKLQNSKKLITLYQKNLIPQSLRSVQTAEEWFRQGDGSFSDFLEVQATAYNFQLSLARAQADYGKALVKLEQFTGVVLDRKTIEIKGEVNHEN